MKNNKKLIGTRINAALADRKVSQKELADYLKVKPNVISYFCSGERTPNTEQIIMISEFLDVPTDFLLGRTKSYNKDEKFRVAVDVTGLSDEAVKTIARLKEENKATWTEDLLNSILINDNFIMILYYLNELSTKVDLNNQNKEPPYYVTTKEIIETALNKYFIKLVDSIIEEYKGCEERDFRIAYELALSLYRKGKLTDEQYQQVLSEYDKGNFEFVPDDFNLHGSADNG
ncbi:helix-turn-helix transcriptional regulator [Ruminococcus sp.]|uniref:helix-turn-helix domain-containing protein n=1 Tax=Ruminococcus sp. TaxID=41978 RepID=UPI0025D04FB5|nr:helix-turn-helix transcriptional regulator [Ruminococcus sp.]MBR1431941.1 helix-turn-helix transcriptional regulator [Ruminococcus sp.]MBR1823961.1 helix-turn-helix transcriptional regulator [Ruminococcus sp.]